MLSYTRRNLLDFSFTFTANDGSNIQPTSAELTLYYLAVGGTGPGISIVPLFALQGQQWIGTWESDVAAPGRVDWEVASAGPLIAVEQGSFILTSNAANMAAS